MATYNSSYYTALTYNSATGTYVADTNGSQLSASTGSDGENNTTFESGDTITITDGIVPSGPLKYEGHTADGYVVKHGSNYYYYSNNAVTAGTTVAFTTTDFTVCFLTGTRIATPQGSVAIEDLRIGDRVLTADGRAEAIRFIGRQTYSTVFADRVATHPVRIRAGALAEGVPAADLWVSPGHALLIDGVLVSAAALINGDTIAQLPAPTEAFTYYNLELDAHEVIVAEGAEVESFAENVPRTRFHNHAEFVALYPEGREVGEMDLPRAVSLRQVPLAIRQQLAARAAVLARREQQAA